MYRSSLPPWPFRRLLKPKWPENGHSSTDQLHNFVRIIQFLMRQPMPSTWSSLGLKTHIHPDIYFYLGYVDPNTHLVPVVAPRSEFHEARLLVEREVAHIDFAGRFENGRRLPHHLPRVMKDGFGHGRHHIFAVRTVNHNENNNNVSAVD